MIKFKTNLKITSLISQIINRPVTQNFLPVLPQIDKNKLFLAKPKIKIRVHLCSSAVKFNHLTNKLGFTLVELMIVIVIIVILSVIAIPNLLGSKDKARRSEAITSLSSLQKAQNMYLLDNGVYPFQTPKLNAKSSDLSPYFAKYTNITSLLTAFYNKEISKIEASEGMYFTITVIAKDSKKTLITATVENISYK
jgi:type II secretion system protein G